MRIDSASIFTFYFPYEGHEIAIPVRAASREEACQKLLNFFQVWGMEVSMEAPKVSKSEPLIDVPVAPVASYALELRIEELIKELVPHKKPKGAQTVDRLVKEWTGFTYEAQNYPAIISELEALKNGNG